MSNDKTERIAYVSLYCFRDRARRMYQTSISSCILQKYSTLLLIIANSLESINVFWTLLCRFLLVQGIESAFLVVAFVINQYFSLNLALTLCGAALALK